jgi:hypothetical protein
MRDNLIGLAAIVLGTVAGIGLAMGLIASQRAHTLPHRPVTELTNWGQGHAPPDNHCPPGTVRIELDDIPVFLECYRGTN